MIVLVKVFENQVRKTPEAIAIEFKNELITYEKLNTQANSIANYLINEQGIKSGDIIPLLLDRSENIVVAMLAVLKTGAAYTALSKQYPQSRIDFVVNQVNAKLIIDDFFMSKDFKQYKSNLDIVISPENKAYIVYTSGTTGNPKGVIHTHKSVYSHISAYSKFVDLEKYNKLNMLFLVNYVFSVATTQIYTALFYGHKLIISEPDCLENIEKFTQYISEKRINYFQSTPSLADSLDFTKLDDLYIVAVAGEKLPLSLFENADRVKLINVYGQSEFHSTTAKILKSKKDINNIGSTLDNMTAYILDKNHREVNVGEIGEICVVGDQLAQGYFKLPEETEEHFMDNPFGEGKICRTGDLVKKLSNNEYEFIGRNDFQININGIRTEPAEVESKINSISGIKNSVVIGYKNQYIVAYYVSDNQIDEKLIKEIVNQKLPEYMRPHFYKWLKKLPLNNNGKLDRKSLPRIDIIRKELLSPTNTVETLLVESIEAILGIPHVSILENFFELGGTSLQAIRLSNLVMKKINKRLTVKTILGNYNIQELANTLANQHQEKETPFTKVQKQREKMSSAQKRMFVIYELDKSRTDYNEQTVLDFSRKINIDRLRTCFEYIVSNHESLRTKFYNNDGEYIQEVLDEGNIDFKVISEPREFSSLVKPFDLSKGCTMRIRYIQGTETDALFVDKHHIITDGMSEEIFYKELSQLYRGEKVEKNSYHYKDYSNWINRLDLDAEKEWWSEYLKDYQRLEIVADYQYQKNIPGKGRTRRVSFDKDLLAEIRRFSKENKISDYIFMFSSISLLLSKMYDSKDFIILEGIKQEILREFY